MNELSVCALTRPLREALRSPLRVKQDTPRVLGVGINEKGEPEAV